MAGPITWRTVQGASLADAARPLALASDAITGGFDRLGALVEKQQGVNQGFVDRADEAVTQNFLERLQSAKSPEQIAAMEASGELASMRASLKPKQLAQVRGAEDARTAGLMTQLTQRNTFQDTQLARDRAPLVNQAKLLAVSGDRAGLQKFLADNDLGDESTFMASLAATERASKDAGYRDAEEQRKVDAAATDASLRPLREQQLRESIKATQAQALYQGEDRLLAADQRAAAKAAAGVAAQQQLLKDTGNIYADGVFTPAHTQDLLTMMVENGIGDDNGERQAIIKRLSSMSELPAKYIDDDGKEATKNIPVPLSLVKQAILGSKDQWANWRSGGGSGSFFGWNQGFANTTEDNLRKSLLEVLPMTTPDGRGYKQNKAVADYDRMMRNRLEAAENPAPQTGKRK